MQKHIEKPKVCSEELFGMKTKPAVLAAGEAVEGALLAAFLVFLAGPIMALKLPFGRAPRARRAFQALIVLGVSFMGHLEKGGIASRVLFYRDEVCFPSKNVPQPSNQMVTA